MNIFEKFIDKLHIGFLNRKNSPSIKAGGNITAGGDIIVGGQKSYPQSAVLNAGKKATFDTCEMIGPDFGMIDVGEDTTVINSKIQSTGSR